MKFLTSSSYSDWSLHLYLSAAIALDAKNIELIQNIVSFLLCQNIFKVNVSPLINNQAKHEGFRGVSPESGAAEKREHHRDSLYFPQILSLIGEFCNPQCIPNCIPKVPLEFSLGVARMVPGNIAGEHYLMTLWRSQVVSTGFVGAVQRKILMPPSGHAWATTPIGHRLCKLENDWWGLG